MVNLYRVKDNETTPCILRTYSVHPQRIWEIREPKLREYFSLSDCGSTTTGHNGLAWKKGIKWAEQGRIFYIRQTMQSLLWKKSSQIIASKA
jgi:hypothetical protein